MKVHEDAAQLVQLVQLAPDAVERDGSVEVCDERVSSAVTTVEGQKAGVQPRADGTATTEDVIVVVDLAMDRGLIMEGIPRDQPLPETPQDCRPRAPGQGRPLLRARRSRRRPGH
jgi:hypothetical protein